MSSSNQAKFTIHYVADPRADIVLRSSDEVDFLVRRLTLQANSEVFDGMFDASSGDVGEKDKGTGLPLIKLDEKGETLDLLLRFIGLNQVRPERDSMSLASTASLFRVSDKYAVELVKELASFQLRTLASTSDTLEILGIGLVHRDLGLIRASLSHFGNGSSVWASQRDVYDYNRALLGNGRLLSGSPHRLANLPIETLQTLSAETIQHLFELEEKVLLDGKKWNEIAASFNFK